GEGRAVLHARGPRRADHDTCAGQEGCDVHPVLRPAGRRACGAPEGAGAMIEVLGLRKSFRDLRRGLVHAVDDVSFTARPGEIFGLLGPNGAGKTTTMRILCTLLRPSGGRATVAGYDVATQPGQVRQHIGIMSANTA